MQKRLSPEDIDRNKDEVFYQKLWGSWFGREEEFFKECAEIVDKLSPEEVFSIGGSEASLYAKLTKDAYKKLFQEEVPERLELGLFQIDKLTKEAALLSSYRPYDPVELPKVLFDVLSYFDGRPTPEVLAEIQAVSGLELEDDLLVMLVDFAILLPCGRL